MVSFKPQGRLGNFLFQAATTIAYALKHNLEYSIPSQTNDQFWNPVYLQHLVNPKWKNGQEDIVVHEVEYFRFDELPFQEGWRNKQIVLKGYFQNQDYFKEYREEILKAFDLPWSPLKRTISVHVRRGDYLQLTDKHPEISAWWYSGAMNQFSDNQKFLFFSDDIEWCKKEFNFPWCSFYTNKLYGNTELDDLIMISKCEHHINSASTFAWWGAWLNQNFDKRVILPKQWYGPKATTQWTEDIVPKEWQRL